MPEADHDVSLLEIAVEVAGVDAELAADLLRQACPDGVAIESSFRLDTTIDAYVVDGDGPSVVKGYLPASPDSARIRRSLRLALAMAPLQSPPRWRRVRRLREQSWRDSWKKHFGVQRIGRSLIVKPSWVEYKLKGSETVIQIDPGMAFGTGQHPTTAMCLSALEELVRDGVSLLDLGCGSGILAIAAAKLGATQVVALDTDPLAVKAATENAAANSVGYMIEVCERTLDVDAPSFDMIVANISSLTLQRLAPALAIALNPRGTLVASGFLDDAVIELSTAFVNAGMLVERVIQDGVWRAIIARKP